MFNTSGKETRWIIKILFCFHDYFGIAVYMKKCRHEFNAELLSINNTLHRFHTSFNVIRYLSKPCIVVEHVRDSYSLITADQ